MPTPGTRNCALKVVFFILFSKRNFGLEKLYYRIKFVIVVFFFFLLSSPGTLASECSYATDNIVCVYTCYVKNRLRFVLWTGSLRCDDDRPKEESNSVWQRNYAPCRRWLGGYVRTRTVVTCQCRKKFGKRTKNAKRDLRR